MFAPQRILCLVDLSAVSSLVLSWARLFAQAFTAPVEVFHAFWSGGEGGDELRELELRGQLEVLARDALGSVRFRVSLGEGHPVKVIFQHIQSKAPELIVMGSHGYDGMARVLLGSVAENVVRMARCPMLIVKGSELSPDQRRLGRVLCPVNLTDFARHTAEIASDVAVRTGAALDLVQVVEQSLVGAEGAEQRLRAWVPPGLGERAGLSILQGDAAEQIVCCARDHGVDLIVLGAEHRQFLEFTTLGRTTERVMRYSPCTVLVVPR